MHITDRLTHIRTALAHHRRHHDCGTQLLILEDLIEELEEDLTALLTALLETPARIHITATLEGHPMADFPVTATANITATVANAEGVDITAVSPVTLTADAGTLTVDPTDSHKATLTDSGIGTVNITATAANGIVGTLAVNFVDNTPATVTVTAA